jgi:hypothetical protein
MSDDEGDENDRFENDSQLFTQQILPFIETSISNEFMCGRVQMTHHCSNNLKLN